MKRKNSKRKLQWGLGLSTEEGRPGRRDRLRLGHGFNGASVFRPRKGRGGTSCMASNSTLQWGLGLSTEEGPIIRFDPSHNCIGFNGASVFRPRKVRQLRQTAHTEIHASMGPRSFDRGRNQMKKHRQSAM